MKNITLSLSALITLSVILLSGTVFAQVDTSALPEAGLKPGDTFYFIDRTAEEFQKVFITDDIKKAEFSAKLSQERLAEAVALTEEGSMTDVERAVAGYARDFGVAAETLMNVDGTLNIEEVIRQKELLAKQATNNLVILGGVTKQSPDTAYQVALVQAKTIDRQTAIIDSIMQTDAELAKAIYDNALDVSVREMRTKADSLDSVSNLATLDSSIQNYSKYLDYGRTSGVSDAYERSVDGVVNILNSVPRNDTTYTTSAWLNDGRETGVRTVNQNADGTVTADTGLPMNTASSRNMGAPAFQSDNGGLNWLEYIEAVTNR